MKLKRLLSLASFVCITSFLVSCDSDSGSSTDVEVSPAAPGALPAEFKFGDFAIINGDENYTIDFNGDSFLSLSGPLYSQRFMRYTYDNEKNEVGTILASTLDYRLVTEGNEVGIKNIIDDALADETSQLRSLVEAGVAGNLLAIITQLDTLINDPTVVFDVINGQIVLVDSVYFSFGEDITERIIVTGSEITFNTNFTTTIDDRRIPFNDRRDVGEEIADEDFPVDATEKILNVSSFNLLID